MALQYFRKFIQLESSAGIILFIAAVLAMIVDNSPLSHYYDVLITAKPVLLWINDGFMSLFFLLIGLEMKREILEDGTNVAKKITLPAIAAIGGMLFPALIYLFFNWHDPVALKGWAIPTATDTAFSLGILSLLGRRIPSSLKLFLMSLAIFDDLGAIIVIAVFYTSHIEMTFLFAAAVVTIVLGILHYLNVKRLSVYCVFGCILWYFLLKSGVHAIIAGVILALFIPFKSKKNVEQSPLQYLEQSLHPWVSFVILPIFAFANAGISFEKITVHHFVSPISLGIAFGLFFGKQIGIWSSTMFAVKLKMASLPKEMNRFSLYGTSLVAGIGFTMSLFIGTLAFNVFGSYGEYVRIGVIFGSIFSGFLGYLVLRLAYSKV